MEIIPHIFSDHNGIKLEINNTRKTGKFKNTWKLNSSLLNNQWSKEEIQGEIKTFLEIGNKTYQDMCDAAKAVLSGKFIALNTYIKKQDRSQINNVTLYLKKLKKQTQTVPKLAEENNKN